MKKRPLLTFFLIAFGLSWGLGWAYSALPIQTRGRIGEVTETHPLYYLATYTPAISAVIVLAVTQGRAGLGAYFRRFLHWRVGWRWYAVVFLGVPSLSLLALLINLAAGDRLPPLTFGNWINYIPIMAFLLTLSPVEELGWRGYALPHLQTRFSAFTSSLILGGLWGLWRLPAYDISGLTENLTEFLLFFLTTIFYSILMTWVYNNTGGSLPLAIFFRWMTNIPAIPDVQPTLTIILGLAALLVTVLADPQTLGPKKHTQATPGIPFPKKS